MKTTEQYMHEPSGVVLYREIAQPHVETFAECFEAFKAYDVSNGGRNHAFEPRYIKERTGEELAVGPSCNVNHDSHFSVRCADWVLSRIRERTIILDGDRMNFGIIDHHNGRSLVVANHDSIIGSVWLAYIKTDSIPEEARGL